MTRLARIVLVASVIVLPLGGCASIGDALDPTEWFAGDFFNSKKKLPGDRKPVFPEGVPGVAQGIPQELVKGNQPPPQESGFATADTQSVRSTPPPQPKQKTAAKSDTKPEEFQPAPREKAKPKPKPKPATAEEPPPAQERVRRAEPQPQQQPQRQPQQQQSGSNAAQWPDPPPPQRGSSQSGGIQWPDPPPLR